jgi:hypothetical protein
MRRATSIIFAACALVISTLVQAGAGWTDYVAVAELVPTAHHYYEVRLPVKENPGGCRNKTWFYQDYGFSGSDKMFQTILEGVRSGFRVRVYVTGKCNLDGYSEISSVSVIP